MLPLYSLARDFKHLRASFDLYKVLHFILDAALSRIPVNDLDQSQRVISRILYPEGVRAQSSLITPHRVPEWLSNPATATERSYKLVPEWERITILGHLAKACERLEQRNMKKELGHFAAAIVANIEKDSLNAEDGNANLYFDLLKCLAIDVLPRSIKHYLSNQYNTPGRMGMGMGIYTS